MTASTTPPFDRRSGRSGVVMVVILLLLGGLVVAWNIPQTQELKASYFGSGDVQDSGKFILHQAESGSFRITITENGTVDSLSNATLKNSVEEAGNIAAINGE